MIPRSFTDYIEVNPKIVLEKDKEYPFIEMSNVGIFQREPEKVDVKKFGSGTKFEKGDTVVARIEPCLQNGKGFFVKDFEVGFGSTEYLVFRSKNESKLDKVYLYYLMQDKYIRENMIRSMTGATGRQRVNNKVFDNIKINIPNLDKQKKIAGILKSYDDLIENNLKRIKLLEESAELIYKEWFVNFRFPGYEKCEFVDGVPKGWETKTLSDTCEIIMGQSPSSDFYNDKRIGLPFHQGVTNFGNRFPKHDKYCSALVKLAQPNDILFSVRAPVGRLNITTDKIVIGRGLAAIRNKDGFQGFQYYQLKNIFFKDNLIGGGTIFASITKKDLENQKVMRPAKQILKEFETMSRNLDNQISNIYNQNKRLKEARDILIPKLIMGEIEV